MAAIGLFREEASVVA